MKRSLVFRIVIALGAILVLWLCQQSTLPSVKVTSVPVISTRHEIPSPKLPVTTGVGLASLAHPKVSPKGGDAVSARSAAYAVIDEASVTYDEQAVVAIAPYLANEDVEIRKMALDGLLRAGDISAAPVLRTAAKKIADPREASKYLDAADFLELPPMGSVKKSAVSAPKK